MPCRCDDYETNSDADKIKDLETRLCRAQSVIKDMAGAINFNKIGFSIPQPLANRAMREMRELAVHKQAEADAEAKEREALERKVAAAQADLDKAKAAKRRQLAQAYLNALKTP